jgi:predicted amidohydrolase
MTNITPAGTVRAAVVQAAPVPFDTPRTLDKLAALTADAARRRAELVVFPKSSVGAYLHLDERSNVRIDTMGDEPVRAIPPRT